MQNNIFDVNHHYSATANCFPQPYTLIPAGILLGAGASIVWSANRVYISDISAAYARRNNRDEGKTTSHFYGIFWAIFSTALLIGNVISSGVLQAFAIEPDAAAGTGVSNATAAYQAEYTTAGMQIDAYRLNEMKGCALHNCDTAPDDSTQSAAQTELNPAVLYILFGSFAAIQFGSAMLLLFFADEAPDRPPVKEEAKKMIWKSADQEKVVEKESGDAADASVTQRVTKQVNMNFVLILIPWSTIRQIDISEDVLDTINCIACSTIAVKQIKTARQRTGIDLVTAPKYSHG